LTAIAQERLAIDVEQAKLMLLSNDTNENTP